VTSRTHTLILTFNGREWRNVLTWARAHQREPEGQIRWSLRAVLAGLGRIGEVPVTDDDGQSEMASTDG
jgi:hypothetical protein